MDLDRLNATLERVKARQDKIILTKDEGLYAKYYVEDTRVLVEFIARLRPTKDEVEQAEDTDTDVVPPV